MSTKGRPSDYVTGQMAVLTFVAAIVLARLFDYLLPGMPSGVGISLGLLIAGSLFCLVYFSTRWPQNEEQKEIDRLHEQLAVQDREIANIKRKLKETDDRDGNE